MLIKGSIRRFHGDSDNSLGRNRIDLVKVCLRWMTGCEVGLRNEKEQM